MARRMKRLWTAEEKRSICFQTTAADVSVAQVARRYAMNANLIFGWLRDPRFMPSPEASSESAQDPSSETASTQGVCFLPVEVVDGAHDGAAPSADAVPNPAGFLEIELVGGHRLRVSGAYDVEALALLIRRLSS